MANGRDSGLADGATAGARDLVFISYSHLNRDWLDRLLIFLKPYMRQGHLSVWSDPDIPTGDNWKRNIDRALSRACTGVLLVAPEFVASDFIHEHELPPLREAADAGLLTLFPIPISACDHEAIDLARYQWPHPPDQPLDAMPVALQNPVFVCVVRDIARAAAAAAPAPSTRPAASAARSVAAVATTHEPGALQTTPALGVLHGVPGQRLNYLRRQDALDALKQMVLGGTDYAVGITGTVPSGTDARVGLHGMGGIGKTALAIDFAGDDDVRRAFPDGIFWLTLGQSSQPLQLQGDLAAYLTGQQAAYATVNEARDALRLLFADKACLLILDDIWQLADAEPFDILGPRGRLLTTTRDADLLVALGARELPLGVLAPAQALHLLAAWSGWQEPALPAIASQVAASCGYLPLALALAGARVRGGADWQEVLAALERGRLEFLDHPYGSVFKSLRLGSDALPPEQRARYFELAVFPDDTDIPEAAIATLWHHTGGMDAAATHDLLRSFDRRALLIREVRGERVSFHDLQHDFLRLNAVSLHALNEVLLEAYRAVSPTGWASGPDDGYFFQHLPRHLLDADRRQEVKELLCDYRWIAAKFLALGVPSLLADCELLADDTDVALVRQALRLSSPTLLQQGDELPTQLTARLGGSQRRTILGMLASMQRDVPHAWLRPRMTSLPRAGGALQQILVGHTSGVRAVAVLADGRRAISASDDKTLRLWDLDTGQTLRRFEGHTGGVNAVAVLADGRRAISASDDRTLRLWDLDTGQTLRRFVRRFDGYTGGVNAVAVLADGRRAVSADTMLWLWDLDTGQILRTLEDHTGYVNAVVVLADGHRAISASGDSALRLWDLDTGQTLRTFEGHNGWVNAVAVLPDGRRAISASDDKTLRLWDLDTGQTLRTLWGHTRGVSAVAVLSDGRRAVSASGDETLQLWDLDTGEALRTFEGHTDWVRAVAALADGRRAISASYDETLRLWDLDTCHAVHMLEGHTIDVNAVAMLADGRRAISASYDRTLRLWDLDTGQTLRTLTGHTRGVRAVAVLSDGRHAVSASGDETLRLWDLDTGQALRTFEGHTDGVNAVAMLADGRCAISASDDKTLRLWDIGTGQTLRALEGHTGGVYAVAALAEGRRAVSASTDKTLRLWNLDTGQTLRALEGHTDRINAVAVLADGRHAISASRDKSLRLWDLDTGQTLRTLEGHTHWVTAVAVLAEGRRAISTSADETLRVWDLETGGCLATFTGDSPMLCVATHDGGGVVAGSANGGLHVLEVRG